MCLYLLAVLQFLNLSVSCSEAESDIYGSMIPDEKKQKDTQALCYVSPVVSVVHSLSFRNWYKDEPSCEKEVCVTIYHQPSAPPGIGGPYMFQWNDDRCNMKNNFICKYSDGNDSFPQLDS